MNPHHTTHKPSYRGLLEPAVGFDFDGVEDPAGVAMEELEAIGITLTHDQARRLLLWIVRSERLPNITQHTVAERLLMWIGDTNETGRVMRKGEDSVDRRLRRVGTRALVAISECTPYATNARLTMHSIAVAAMVSKNTIQGIFKEFRKTMGGI